MIQRLCVMKLKLYNSETNFIKKETCRKQNFYILITFFSITIALLITVSIYCYLMKYRAKQKHLLPFNFTINELKQKHLLLFRDTKTN